MSVYKHLSPVTLIIHVWIGEPCCVQASVSTHVSNTFCGSWSVYIISIQPLSQTRLIVVSYLCTCISILPCVSNTFGLWILVSVQVSVLSQNGYRRYCLHRSDVNLVFLHVISGLDHEGGDGYKHGCLDALAITLSLRWSSQESCNNGYPCSVLHRSMY